MDYFERPLTLILFLPLFFLLLFTCWKGKLNLSLEGKWDRNTKLLNDFKTDFQSILKKIVGILPFLSLSFVILAAAGPGAKHRFIPDETYGIDIMIALDISGSMVNSYDFLPNNRLSVSKKLLQEFIKKRESDRIGLVLFAGAAYLQSPLTSDRLALTELIAEAEDSSIDEQGTAIGDALILSTYRLKKSKATSKIILILTDGVSNTGKLDPETASFASKAYSIKVYSIGIGKEMGQYEINYDSLRAISEQTGGTFFRAESPEDLEEILKEIDDLEKDPLPSKPIELVQTHFPDYLFWSFVLLLLDGSFKIWPLKEML
ncbi:VWA domain-containing protein BatA [Leptospira ilyithenensis]|uniref:VWA domain-containing protein n=1 Tax=Leptospira ilyithenensis TaxID=2484901 RepID=A0A4R9LXS7_9LEPT|nr:VWA domain-containing protein [Leptospira ilyithenensis]TGN14561.1 VWA domain-containing protein [Leptospira ilyithenensis]